MKLIIEMKGYSDTYKGTFEGIYINDFYLDGKERECMRLHEKEIDTVYDCPTENILRYWYKNKWIYVANKK